MASRAPVLAKPKPKAKPTAKSSVTKSIKTTPSTKNPIAKVKLAESKVVAVKPSSSKASLVKAPHLKAPPASKSTGSKNLSATDASAVTSVSKSLPANVKSKTAKPAESKLTIATKSSKTLSTKPSSDTALLDDAKVTGTASFEPAVPKPRRRSKGEIRTRIYWAVFNQSLRRVAVFEFDQRVEAEKRADKLAKASGEHHFIQKIKAIVQ